MIDLKLSRQLIKEVYIKKLKYEEETLEKITMSEFIEESLMEYLNIKITDMNSEKIPVRLDMYYQDNIFNDKKPDIKPDIKPDNLDYEDISFMNYVYVYMNPFKKLENEIILDISGDIFNFDYEPFYIGKGKGNRMFQHLKLNNSDKNYDKINTINEIISNGGEPIIRIIKNELCDHEAFTLENIIITKLDSLTNIIGGKSKKEKYLYDNKNYTLEYNKNKHLFNLISKGMRNKDIAETLGISERSIYRLKAGLKSNKSI